MKRRLKAERRGWFNRVAALALLGACAAGSQAMAAPAPSHEVTFNSHSFFIDGKRVYLWSGEFHPFRLPSPALWSDVLQKMKAAGFNTVSIYFSWGYHSPREGVYDFTGIRDIDRMLDAARDAGMYVIARPSPYINAEVDSGGLPLWLTTKKLNNRSADPEYLRYADEWLTQVDRIIARHQLVDGGGTVIGYQVENEYYLNGEDSRTYMEHLKQKARADGIRVPLLGNHDGAYVEGKGAMEVSGWDFYPQGFDCSNPSVWKPAPDMARSRKEGEPLFTAEFQGGAFDPWGGPGYAKCAELINDSFANVFYKSNIAAGATGQNFYMLYGGTSWGWQAIPQNYTSYDYGAAITEARQFEGKYYEDKRIGYFVTTTAPLARTDAMPSAWLDDRGLIDIARVNPETGTQFHLIRHADSTSTAQSSARFSVTVDGQAITLPQKAGTALAINGRQAKMVVVGYPFGAQRLRYSTSEVMTAATIGGRDFLVLYGDRGTAGEASFRVPANAQARVVRGAVHSDLKDGQLSLDYTHDGLAEVVITGGERPLVVLLADRQATERIWRTETAVGPVLMVGSHLLRTATVTGKTLALAGDSDTDKDAIVFGPGTTAVTWNGASVPVTPSGAEDGALAVTLPAPAPVALPALKDWQARDAAPEIAPGFDDHAWRVADLTTSNSITNPLSHPVLLADDYGFHTGNTWYRGHFSGTGADVPRGVRLRVLSGATGGAFSAWLNGHFLGSVQRGDDGTFPFPQGWIEKGDNVVSVLTVNMGHEEDYQSRNENRTGRGIAYASALGAPDHAISWRIQGHAGGEAAMDPVRGPYNEGGLFGEREGWHLKPGALPQGKPVTLPASEQAPGVTWYRTHVALSLPKDQDTSLGVEFRDPPGRHYRALLFVNGWQMGQYVSDIGPQHSFPIPNGVLLPQGDNTIDIAVWKTDEGPGGLGEVSLVNYGSYKSSMGAPSSRR
ncbi:beta-galactosidase [Nitrospirillum sp. BR 11828]|uniref:beta-galactosidase n=1 Tax=Nitrospirillum sp. BR 11828 TaxID=3104325 RepID=UPI002ACA8A4F|nr:beta-galactosidase [Nitrospirillum sp. BR 11828]MDZ5649392.1 beta-galactosidase [Nitrospirillum sp. BR 11828]